MKWVQSEKSLFVGVLALFVLSVVWGFYSWQVRNELADLRFQASAAVRQMEMMEARLAQAIDPPDLAEMNQAVPSDWQIPRFFADLTMLFNTHNIQIHTLTLGEPIQSEPVEDMDEDGEVNENLEENNEAMQNNEDNGEASFSPEPPTPLSGVHTLPLVMEVKGNIAEVLAFIDRLQDLPRLVWVTGFELLVEDPDEDGARIYEKPIDLRINLNLYSHAPWDTVELAEDWPFDIQPADNKEAFDAL